MSAGADDDLPDDLLREMTEDAGGKPASFGDYTKADQKSVGALYESMERQGDLPLEMADPALYPFKGTLTPSQLRALGEADMKRGHAYWIDAGGGKTGVCIAEASRAYAEGLIDGVIVTAPLGPHAQWIDEQFPRWCAVPWRGVDNQWAKGRIESFFERANDDVLPVLVLNHDALRTRPGWRLIDRFMERFPRTYVALDESSRLKSPEARRTQGATDLAHRAAFRRVLSGTPILKGVEDLFAQYNAVEPGIVGYRTFAPFRRYYCVLAPVPGTRFAQRIVGYRNERELARRTAPFATRIPSSEFRNSDPLFMRLTAPMTNDQARIYREMSETLMAEMEDETVTVSNALAKMTKLFQIASGYLFDADGNVHWLSDAKIDAINGLLDDLDEPVVLFAPFIPLQNKLHEALLKRKDRPVFRYDGRASVLAWQSEGGVILGNQGSGLGIGQNLQNAAATIYAANTFAAEPRWQSLIRTDRMGQTRQPRYWDVVAPGTLDLTALDEVLAHKEDVSTRNLEALRRLLKPKT